MIDALPRVFPVASSHCRRALFSLARSSLSSFQIIQSMKATNRKPPMVASPTAMVAPASVLMENSITTHLIGSARARMPRAIKRSRIERRLCTCSFYTALVVTSKSPLLRPRQPLVDPRPPSPRRPTPNLHRPGNIPSSIHQYTVDFPHPGHQYAVRATVSHVSINYSCRVRPPPTRKRRSNRRHGTCAPQVGHCHQPRQHVPRILDRADHHRGIATPPELPQPCGNKRGPPPHICPNSY